MQRSIFVASLKTNTIKYYSATISFDKLLAVLCSICISYMLYNYVAKHTIVNDTSTKLILFIMELPLRPATFRPKPIFDCIKITLDYTTIKDSVNAVLAFSTCLADARKLIEHRKSPIRLFSQLVDDPYQLLQFMYMERCVLSGSRAANYFVPGSCEFDSDWDFYITGHERDDVPPMVKKLETLGVYWYDHKIPASNYNFNDFVVYSGEMTRGKGKGKKVQLVNVLTKDILDALLDFHSTSVQCFVSPYAAVHLYGSIANNRQTIVWDINNAYNRNKLNERNIQSCDHCFAMQSLYNEVPNLCTHQNFLQVVSNLRNMQKSQDELLLPGISNVFNPDMPLMSASSVVCMTTHELRAYIEDQFDYSRSSMRAIDVNRLLRIAFSKQECVQDVTDTKLQQYINRGYTEISTDKYTDDGNWYRTRFAGYRVRSLGDRDSIIITFEGHYDKYNSQQNYIYLTAASVKERISRFVWYEYYTDVPMIAMSHEPSYGNPRVGCTCVANKWIVSDHTRIESKKINLAMM